MKTIFDAVNEFKGEIKFTGIRHIVCNQSSGSIHYWYHDSLDDLATPQWGPLCSVEEFNKLVAEMVLGLDVNRVSHQSYVDYLSSNKEPLEPIKQESKIYTQEMCDNGELPPIGSIFIDIELDDEEQLEAIAHDLALGRVIYKRGSTLQDSEYFGAQAHECKPIPPIPPTALIDGEAYQFDIDSLVVNGIYRKMDNKLYNYNGDFGVEYCTNIKPLTLEGSNND